MWMIPIKHVRRLHCVCGGDAECDGLWVMPKSVFISHRAEKNYEHLENHLVHPHYLKDGKIGFLIFFFKTKDFGLE